MARIRSLHPSQPTDETFVALSPWARLLCLHIRCEADDNGVFEWKPVTLKMRIFPADNLDIGALLGELETHRHVKRFRAGGKEYGAIRNFKKFQRPQKPNAVHPYPDDIRPFVSGDDKRSEPDHSDTATEPLPDTYDTGTVNAPQMERKEEGKEEGKKKKKAAREARVFLGEDFWKGYPHPPNPGSRVKAITRINKLPESEQRAAVASLPGFRGVIAETRKKMPDYQPPMAETFVDGKRWEGLADSRPRETLSTIPDHPDPECAKGWAEMRATFGDSVIRSWFMNGEVPSLKKNCAGFAIETASELRSDRIDQQFKPRLHAIFGRGNWRVELVATPAPAG